jgi:hypothetical protein
MRRRKRPRRPRRGVADLPLPRGRGGHARGHRHMKAPSFLRAARRISRAGSAIHSRPRPPTCVCARPGKRRCCSTSLRPGWAPAAGCTSRSCRATRTNSPGIRALRALGSPPRRRLRRGDLGVDDGGHERDAAERVAGRVGSTEPTVTCASGGRSLGRLREQIGQVPPLPHDLVEHLLSNRSAVQSSPQRSHVAIASRRCRAIRSSPSSSPRSPSPGTSATSRAGTEAAAGASVGGASTGGAPAHSRSSTADARS